MTEHASGTPEQWLAARLELLEAEKELTRRSDEVARQRRDRHLGVARRRTQHEGQQHGKAAHPATTAVGRFHGGVLGPVSRT